MSNMHINFTAVLKIEMVINSCMSIISMKSMEIRLLAKYTGFTDRNFTCPRNSGFFQL